MTEITDTTRPLPAAVERFVLHWGDLGGQWGVNRSVAQIHALLYLSERPLAADDIAPALRTAVSGIRVLVVQEISSGRPPIPPMEVIE